MTRFLITTSPIEEATNYVLWALTPDGYLIGQRVAASSIDVEGLGSSQPVADNATAEGRARNRRVEIVISGGAARRNMSRHAAAALAHQP